MDMGGNFKFGTPDEVATQEDINTRKGVERVIRFAFDYARSQRPQESHDVRQVERDDLRRRPLAARLQRGGGRILRHSARSTCTWTRSACRWCASRSSLDVIVTNNMFGDIITDLAAALAGRTGHGRQRQHPSRTHFDV